MGWMTDEMVVFLSACFCFFHFSVCCVSLCLSHRCSGSGFPGWADGYLGGGWRGVARRCGAWHDPTHHHDQQQRHHVEPGGQGHEEVSARRAHQQGQGSGPSDNRPGRQREHRAVYQATDAHFQPISAQGRSSHQPDTHRQRCLLSLLRAGGQRQRPALQQPHHVWSWPLFVQPAGGRAGVLESGAKPHAALSQHQRAPWLWPLNPLWLLTTWTLASDLCDPVPVIWNSKPCQLQRTTNTQTNTPTSSLVTPF